jgi:hypothetical protein
MTDDLTIQLPDGFTATFRSDGIAISNIEGGLHMANITESIMAQEIARLRAAQGEPVADTRLTDEEMLHFWDIHVGMPTDKYPLNYKDVCIFARAIEAAIRKAAP